MVTRRLGISEARRLLPELVRSVAADGGRVDITYRGKAQVSLLRLADIKAPRTSKPARGKVDPALRIVLKVPDEDLIQVIRQLRATQGHARTGWLDERKPAPRPMKAATKRRRRPAK